MLEKMEKQENPKKPKDQDKIKDYKKIYKL